MDFSNITAYCGHKFQLANGQTTTPATFAGGFPFLGQHLHAKLSSPKHINEHIWQGHMVGGGVKLWLLFMLKNTAKVERSSDSLDTEFSTYCHCLPLSFVFFSFYYLAKFIYVI